MTRSKIPCWERFEEVAAHYEYDEGKTREVAEHLSARRQGYTSAKTIKAGVHGVPGGENMIRFEDGSIRYLTVHEAKLLQTFPPDFKITGAWGEAMRQIGNAVPVTLAEQLGSSLAQLIRPTEDALQIPTDHKKNRNRTKIPQNSIQDFYAV